MNIEESNKSVGLSQGSNMTVWCKNKTHSIVISASKIDFLVNSSESLVYIWSNMGPNACNWIIGTPESHENALWTV